MEIKIDVKQITIITGDGPDTVLLLTTLPQGHWPFDKESQSMKLTVAAEMGECYVNTHFPGIPYEVIGK